MANEDSGSSKWVLYLVIGLAVLCGGTGLLAVVVVAAIAVIGTNLNHTFNEVAAGIEAEPALEQPAAEGDDDEAGAEPTDGPEGEEAPVEGEEDP